MSEVITDMDDLYQFADDLEQIAEDNPAALDSHQRDVLVAAADVMRAIGTYFNRLDAALHQESSDEMWNEFHNATGVQE